MDWNDDRGYGFITSYADGARLFAHISEFPSGPRPVRGCKVTYVAGRDARNRARATQVRYLDAPAAERPVARGATPARPTASRSRQAVTRPTGAPARSGGGASAGTTPAMITSAAFFAGLMLLVGLGELPALVLAGYVLLSGVSFLVYRSDKSAAQEGRWRTAESTLHAIDLVGGWPGGLVARHVFRHKTTKQPFRTVFWLTVLVNCAALAWFAFAGPGGTS